ncbi:hypothetical protein K491DRAFT_516501 [Lophiostoma macrostomum CBS 122681]|uniref:TNFR-Cys domain-containing protein n=1 Tax=Lophiostoma macrostomum CBS 122681 TaxID=1314788 RepID=A0A6A6T3H5_9PLEO|nr:hypothetical protein K491DRAFT_516501 [Lophiostoma macrostomum CBS 122681]
MRLATLITSVVLALAGTALCEPIAVAGSEYVAVRGSSERPTGSGCGGCISTLHKECGQHPSEGCLSNSCKAHKNICSYCRPCNGKLDGRNDQDAEVTAKVCPVCSDILAKACEPNWSRTCVRDTCKANKDVCTGCYDCHLPKKSGGVAEREVAMNCINCNAAASQCQSFADPNKKWQCIDRVCEKNRHSCAGCSMCSHHEAISKREEDVPCSKCDWKETCASLTGKDQTRCENIVCSRNEAKCNQCPGWQKCNEGWQANTLRSYQPPPSDNETLSWDCMTCLVRMYTCANKHGKEEQDCINSNCLEMGPDIDKCWDCKIEQFDKCPNKPIQPIIQTREELLDGNTDTDACTECDWKLRQCRVTDDPVRCVKQVCAINSSKCKQCPFSAECKTLAPSLQRDVLESLDSREANSDCKLCRRKMQYCDHLVTFPPYVNLICANSA